MCDIAKQLFQLKSKNPHTSWVTQESTFNNNESHISKTIPNIEIRRAEHKDTQRLETMRVIRSLGKFSCRPQQMGI